MLGERLQEGQSRSRVPILEGAAYVNDDLTFATRS